MKSIIFFLCLSGLAAKAQDYSQYAKREFVRDGNTLLYRVLFPLNYDARRKYPLVMFLHGSGERGSDNEAQLLHGGSLFLQDSLRSNYPAIVIFPQCPKDSSWAFVEHHYDSAAKKMSFGFPFRSEPTVPAGLVKALMDSLIRAKAVDKKRVYIGGLSMGGFGTFNMLERYPHFFAAAIPICGGGDTLMANRFSRIPGIWIFHGDKDPAVNVENSRAYFRALQRLHARVKYTEYPGVGHNSWDNAFAEKDLLHWLFSNEKK
ncbi:MAG: prolyl oligopeptidase family serine peptidase [Puia sp.]|nr:prolyl oligopeptidase family serine peptidase [Puia sp.]